MSGDNRIKSITILPGRLYKISYDSQSNTSENESFEEQTPKISAKIPLKITPTVKKVAVFENHLDQLILRCYKADAEDSMDKLQLMDTALYTGLYVLKSSLGTLNNDLRELSSEFTTPRPKVPYQETDDTDLSHLTMEMLKSEFITACVKMTSQFRKVAGRQDSPLMYARLLNICKSIRQYISMLDDAQTFVRHEIDSKRASESGSVTNKT